jgi:hypothetical protein
MVSATILKLDFKPDFSAYCMPRNSHGPSTYDCSKIADLSVKSLLNRVPYSWSWVKLHQDFRWTRYSYCSGTSSSRPIFRCIICQETRKTRKVTDVQTFEMASTDSPLPNVTPPGTFKSPRTLLGLVRSGSVIPFLKLHCCPDLSVYRNPWNSPNNSCTGHIKV